MDVPRPEELLVHLRHVDAPGQYRVFHSDVPAGLFRQTVQRRYGHESPSKAETRITTSKGGKVHLSIGTTLVVSLQVLARSVAITDVHLHDFVPPWVSSGVALSSWTIVDAICVKNLMYRLSAKGQVAIHRLHTGSCLAVIDISEVEVQTLSSPKFTCLGVDSDGKFLALGGEHGTAVSIDLAVYFEVRLTSSADFGCSMISSLPNHPFLQENPDHVHAVDDVVSLASMGQIDPSSLDAFLHHSTIETEVCPDIQTSRCAQMVLFQTAFSVFRV